MNEERRRDVPDMRNITVMSRQSVKNLLPMLDHDVAVISISSVSGIPLTQLDDAEHVVKVLHLIFDDVLADDQNPMTEDDARCVVAFLRSLPDGLPLIVHCDGGVSRSAGIGAACMLIENGDDMPVFNSARYVPNMTCYRRVLNAAFDDVDDVEVDEKEKINERVWWAVHDDYQ